MFRIKNDEPLPIQGAPSPFYTLPTILNKGLDIFRSEDKVSEFIDSEEIVFDVPFPREDVCNEGT